MLFVVCWFFKVLSFSFSIYCLTRALSESEICTLRFAGWKPTKLRRVLQWLSLHRVHPVNVPIQRTAHLSSVSPANDTKVSMFGYKNFSRCEPGSNLSPIVPEACALTTELPRYWTTTFKKKIFQEYHQSVQQFRSRSPSPTFCRCKLFA